MCYEGNNYCLFFVSRFNWCVSYEHSFFDVAYGKTARDAGGFAEKIQPII